MKKLIICLLTLLPFIASAQDEDPILLKEFYKGVKSNNTSFVLNEHVNIMQINIDDENFDVAAIDDKMQVLWTANLKGYVIATRKFKDKILAVASTEHSNIKQTNNTFVGYILDPKTGKVLVEKTIFDAPQDYMSIPYVFTCEGEIFKFALRQTGFERRLHVAMPSLLGIISMNKYTRQYNETKVLDIIDFNDKLEPINKTKPVLAGGTFITMNANKQSDLFIAWYNEGSMDVAKYEAGKTTATKIITGTVVLDKDILDSFGGNDIFLLPSKKDPNIAYYALSFRNPDKETELGIEKLDFATGKKQYVNEVFAKDHAKELRKAFVPVNKKMDSPDLGPLRALSVRSFNQTDDRLIITLASTSTSSGMNGGVWVNEFSIVVNGYDNDLNPKFQQLIPTGYSVPSRHLPVGIYYNKTKLYIVSNDKRGMTTLNGTYCSIDLATGQCDKMYWLSKKKIGNSDYAASASVLWYGNGFIVPYMDMRGFTGSKFDITLQQNLY